MAQQERYSAPLDGSIVDFIDTIPHDIRFLNREELHLSSLALADAHPDRVRLHRIGTSACGQDIELTEVRASTVQPERKPRYAFLLGTLHPGEISGALSTDHTTRQFAEHPELIREFGDYDGIVGVPVSDPDGMQLNEGWFNNFSALTYLSNMYRQPIPQQIEWSFPIHYKRLHFDNTPPETAAIMGALRRYDPKLFWSLHNSALGRAYFYADLDQAAKFTQLSSLAAHVNMPLHTGGVEMPYATQPIPGVYSPGPSAKLLYDYFKSNGADPLAILKHGGGSKDYLNETVRDAKHFLSEISYFDAPVLDDQSPSGITSRNASLESLELQGETLAYIAEHSARLERAPQSPLLESVRWHLSFYDAYNIQRRNVLSANRSMGASDEITVGEAFKKRHIDSVFYLLACPLCETKPLPSANPG